jgi:hypothetical protein
MLKYPLMRLCQLFVLFPHHVLGGDAAALLGRRIGGSEARVKELDSALAVIPGAQESTEVHIGSVVVMGKGGGSGRRYVMVGSVDPAAQGKLDEEWDGVKRVVQSVAHGRRLVIDKSARPPKGRVLLAQSKDQATLESPKNAMNRNPALHEAPITLAPLRRGRSVETAATELLTQIHAGRRIDSPLTAENIEDRIGGVYSIGDIKRALSSVGRMGLIELNPGPTGLEIQTVSRP